MITQTLVMPRADTCQSQRNGTFFYSPLYIEAYLLISLRMIPNPSSMVKEELELIDTVASLAKLSGDDTELLPIQVRLEKDRFALIRNALHQNLSIARNLSEVDTVALRLCKGSFSETDILVRVRSVTVSLLLDRDEPSRALKLALETCAKVTESKLDPESATLSEFLLHVMQLVKSPKVSDIAGKCALLNGALVFCPSGELDTILELFETIDMESLSEDSTLVFDPSEADLIMKSLLDQSLALKTGSNSPPQTLSHTRAQDPFVFRNTNTETLSKKQRKLQLLEDCLSCHNGTDNLKLWDQAILEIATLVHSDTPYLSSGYLLNLSDVSVSF